MFLSGLTDFCDLKKKKYFSLLLQRLTSDEVEAKLRDVLLVLKYVQNKDVFMRYHKVHCG